VSWTDASALRAQVVRLWERGELLRDLVTGDNRFPLRLTLKGPLSADITERFDLVRAWAAELGCVKGLRLERQDVRHRVQGNQRLPAAAWIDSLDDALEWLGKRRDWKRFAALVDSTRSAQPALLEWIARRPLAALELADDWPALLAVIGWLQANPRPGIYLRQVDIPKVDTKFIEGHRGVLAELLDLALPPGAIDTGKIGAARFNARYGFLDKPVRIRLRVLDPAVATAPGLMCPDLALDADNFCRLSLAVRRVFITENETSYLAFPQVGEAAVLFGAGYGWEALGRCRWLHDCALHYWGDIDTHGFAILDGLRRHFPHAASFLMDRATLDAHAAMWGSEDKPMLAELAALTPGEQALYDDLRFGRIRPGLRLEQEHIRFGWLQQRLHQLVAMDVSAA
jgi:hypothetical protein